MPYGRFATTLVGTGEARQVQCQRVDQIQRDGVAERVERVAQRGLQRAIELDDMRMRDEWREVLAQDSQPAADLKHHIVGAAGPRRAR